MLFNIVGQGLHDTLDRARCFVVARTLVLIISRVLLSEAKNSSAVDPHCSSSSSSGGGNSSLIV
jgi:hypothetical protein